MLVSRESICICFLQAALNNLKVLSADVASVYLNGLCSEKVYTILGQEFGDCAGKLIRHLILYEDQMPGLSREFSDHCKSTLQT